MFHRILTAPPGYAPHEKYMVAVYRTLDFGSCIKNIKNVDGTLFYKTLEEARKAIPADARQLTFQPDCQFLELWESPEPVG